MAIDSAAADSVTAHSWTMLRKASLWGRPIISACDALALHAGEAQWTAKALGPADSTASAGADSALWAPRPGLTRRRGNWGTVSWSGHSGCIFPSGCTLSFAPTPRAPSLPSSSQYSWLFHRMCAVQLWQAKERGERGCFSSADPLRLRCRARYQTLQIK